MGNDTLWKDAMNKLKEDRSMFNLNDLCILEECINEYNKPIQEGVLNQIEKDMRVYKKYDAIAMWVGYGALIKHEPEFITELVGLFGVTE